MTNELIQDVWNLVIGSLSDLDHSYASPPPKSASKGPILGVND
jgi:hypothetical protein